MANAHIAKLMWDAYAIQAGGKTFDGKPLPSWDELGDERQSCWIAAASVTADRIEKLEEALCNVTTAWDLWQKASDSNSFTELFACICEAKALEKKEPLEWTENYGQGSEPWLNKE